MSQTHPANVPARRPNDNVLDQAEQQNEDETTEEDGVFADRFMLFNMLPSWSVSFFAHVIIIVLLAIFTLATPQDRDVSFEVGENTATPGDDVSLDLEALDLDDSTLDTELSETEPLPLVEPTELAPLDTPVDFESLSTTLDNLEFEASDSAVGYLAGGNEISRRSATSKAKLLRRRGGNAASEEAVRLALQWIVDHQLPDGGWKLNHQDGPDPERRSSPNPGTLSNSRFGATALALLPLLGAGHTHLTGEYKKEVQKGLEFLMSRGNKLGQSYSFMDGGGELYSHGLCAIVFNEAFAMTNDPKLKPYAQGTLLFIESAQDPSGGGWRYQPGERGDTSAVGWQIMALKSGKFTKLKIKPKTLKLAEKFLDSVSTENGAFYGYLTPTRSNRKATALTSVGLLCRMYMGWPKDHPGLKTGVEALSKRGPDVDEAMNMYYNYYATQVMSHYGGRKWKKWNVKMRDQLIKTQIKSGVATGSWNPAPGTVGEGNKGGRLYMTSLCCMTLEVYYRYLPLYSDRASSDEFLLE